MASAVVLLLIWQHTSCRLDSSYLHSHLSVSHNTGSSCENTFLIADKPLYAELVTFRTWNRGATEDCRPIRLGFLGQPHHLTAYFKVNILETDVLVADHKHCSSVPHPQPDT
jgi:hypothetical protein